MPRLRKRLICATPPITGAEVDTLWRQIIGKPPYPSRLECNAQAEQLTLLSSIGYGTSLKLRTQELAPAAAAVRRLISIISAYLEPFEGARSAFPPSFRALNFPEYSILVEARPTLVELLAVFDPNFTISQEQAVWLAQRPGASARLDALHQIATEFRLPHQGPIWEQCGVLCWLLARDVLAAIGRKGGKSRDALAVKFAAAVLPHLGFQQQISPNALAKRLAKHPYL